jgi:hypothetical protein
MARRFESPHLSFSLSGRLMRYFTLIVQALVLAMFGAWQDLALGGRVTF